jgi:hypothetical protein
LAARTGPPLSEALQVLSAEEEAAHRLTGGQWAAVRRSIEYRRNPAWRFAQRDGAARTLRGSYRRSYSRYSEFVGPAGAAAAGAEMAEAEEEEEVVGDEEGEAECEE